MTRAAPLALVLAAAACGGAEDPFCGDGVVQQPEQCDDGNADDEDFCRACVVYLPPRTVVKWRFNADAADGFNQDGCVDTGTSTVRVELAGPTSAAADGMCSQFQVAFEELPAGTYTASVTPLDSAGEPLVHAPVEAELAVAAAGGDHTINVPPEAWIGPYTGTFFFAVSWEGMGCTVGMVDQQRLTLRVGGVVVTQLTEDGQRLDGTMPGACIEPDRPTPQAALAVPFGPATIEVVGLRAGIVDYRGTFETFVGAGPSNPTLVYDVPTIYDAMPADAMPPDAATPDAM